MIFLDSFKPGFAFPEKILADVGNSAPHALGHRVGRMLHGEAEEAFPPNKNLSRKQQGVCRGLGEQILKS